MLTRDTAVIVPPQPAPVIPDPNPNPEPAPIIPDPAPEPLPDPGGVPEAEVRD